MVLAIGSFDAKIHRSHSLSPLAQSGHIPAGRAKSWRAPDLSCPLEQGEETGTMDPVQAARADPASPGFSRTPPSAAQRQPPPSGLRRFALESRRRRDPRVPAHRPAASALQAGKRNLLLRKTSERFGFWRWQKLGKHLQGVLGALFAKQGD